jgi:hypothetical protein
MVSLSKKFPELMVIHYNLEYRHPNLERINLKEPYHGFNPGRSSGGLGSGLYVILSKNTEAEIELPRRAGERSPVGLIIGNQNLWKNPVILRTLDNSYTLENVGKNLLTCIINLFPRQFSQFSKTWSSWYLKNEDQTQELGERIIQDLKSLGIKVKSADLEKAGEELLKDAQEQKYDWIDQPINYLLKSLGYDGVVNFAANNTRSGSVLYNYLPFVEFLMSKEPTVP